MASSYNFLNVLCLANLQIFINFKMNLEHEHNFSFIEIAILLFDFFFAKTVIKKVAEL